MKTGHKRMDKYIKVSDTISELNMYHMPETVGETGMELINRKAYNTMLEIAKMVVNAQPTADVAPVIHAHWEREEDYEGTHHICSNCHSRCPSIMTVPATVDYPYGEVEEIELSEIVYCPSCGSKMDEEVEQ